jgi:hypothetical protein
MANKTILVACPTCEAQIGVRCLKQGGKYTPEWWSHRSRVLRSREPDAFAEGLQMAVDGMEDFIQSQMRYAFECCGTPFADLGAVERHRASGHESAVVIGLTPTAQGWSSR